MKHVIVELASDGNDHRPLGRSGVFLTGTYGESDVADFPTSEAAMQAAERAPNRRPNCQLWFKGGKLQLPAEPAGPVGRDPKQLSHPGGFL
jgi:hypothetical protein